MGHTHTQQFWLDMCDDGVPAMLYEVLCTTKFWSPSEGLLIWDVMRIPKKTLPNWEPKPCKPISMKNVEDIIKGILAFIQ